MRGITVRRNDDTIVTFKVPRGCKLRRCLRALHAMNSGTDLAGLTEQESEFVADMVAKLQEVPA